MLRQAAQVAACALRSASTVVTEAGSQQVRRMAGGGSIIHKTYNGKPVPAELQGPDYVTYAGATIKKHYDPLDTIFSKLIGAAVTFTFLYHFYLNAEEHWYGDIYYLERDAQKNGWDDEGSHGHGHGHGHAHH